MTDIDERIKTLAINTSEQEGETFSDRAESYYTKRPQLLALLQDLYIAYVNLSNRYIQALGKKRHLSRRASSIDIDFYEQQQEDGDISLIESDAESSISYQQPPTMLTTQDMTTWDGSDLVSKLVLKNVECDILLSEIKTMDKRSCESYRKIELQKSLLEVLESERLILSNENASLGYRVATLVEENKGLTSESLFMKRKASELARCVLKMREDQRVCMLSRKIEDLQGQIYGLEKRNKEYYNLLIKTSQQVQSEESSINKKNSSGSGNEVTLEACFQMGKVNRKLMRKASGKNDSSWWQKVKNMDMFLCGLSPTT